MGGSQTQGVQVSILRHSVGRGAPKETRLMEVSPVGRLRATKERAILAGLLRALVGTHQGVVAPIGMLAV